MSEYENGMYEISKCQKILISISYGLCTMQYYHILHEIDNFPHPLRQKITSIVCLKACFLRARAWIFTADNISHSHRIMKLWINFIIKICIEFQNDNKKEISIGKMTMTSR